MADLDQVRVAETSVIPYYGFVFGQDSKLCETPGKIEIEIYEGLNKKIDEVLRRHRGCSWNDIPIYKVERLENICLEDDLPVIPIPQEGLELVPLVPPKELKPRPAAKKCEMGKVSQLALDYAKFFKEAASRCAKAELKKFGLWNKELDALLKRHHCSWADFKGLKKVETLADLGCPPKVAKEVAKIVVPSELAALPPTTVVTKAPPKSYLATYFGIGAGVAGAVLLGVGGLHFGLESNRLADQAHGASVQLEAIRLEQQANGAAKNANGLIGAGIGLIAIGAGLVALDLLEVWGSSPSDPSPSDPPTQPTTSLTVGPGSVYLEVRF